MFVGPINKGGAIVKAFGYARITREEELSGLESINSQRARIMDYAKRQNVQLLEVMTDEPLSGLKNSPALKDACTKGGIVDVLDYSRRRKCDFVIVTDLTRLERHDLSFNPVSEVKVQGLKIVPVDLDLKLESLLPKSKKRRSRSLKEGKDLSVAERLLLGRRECAKAGKHQSGPAPFGYMRDYTDRKRDGVRLKFHPDEAPVVRVIFKEYLRRKSMKRLIIFLEKQGIRTRRGKQWSRAGLSWILKNETYLGRVHFGNIRAKGQHAPIVSPIIFNKVQKLIKKNNKRGGRDKAKLREE